MPHWLCYQHTYANTPVVPVTLHLQEKGIRKRKRSKLVFDEEAKEWRRRHGYKRVNDDADVPVIEARSTDKVSRHTATAHGDVG